MKESTLKTKQETPWSDCSLAAMTVSKRLRVRCKDPTAGDGETQRSLFFFLKAPYNCFYYSILNQLPWTTAW